MRGADTAACKTCGSENDPLASFCRECGNRLAKVTTNARRCPSCSTSVEISARFCAACGFRIPSPGGGKVHRGGAESPAQLTEILKDGSDGRVHLFKSATMDIGRAHGDMILEDDPYVSDRHARLEMRGDDFFIKDLDSLNGIYARIRDPVELHSGDTFLLGQQLLRLLTLGDEEVPLGPAASQGILVFGTPEVPRIGCLVQMTTEGVGRDTYYLYREETFLGREGGDIVFSDDPYLSRRHASITMDRAKRRFTLRDLGSSNGTFVRRRGELPLRSGDQVRIGRHVFRFDARGNAS